MEPQRHPPDFLDKDITIRISPWKIIKSSVFLAVFLLVFWAGRWSATECGECSVTAPLVAEEALAQESPSFLSGFATFFAGLFESDDAETNQSSPQAEASSASPTVELSEGSNQTALEKEETKEAEETEETDELIITKYSKVNFAITNVKIDWKGNWGKITHLEYTLKNSEAGTVLPDHFLMTVEGYSDFEKKVLLPPSSKKVKAGTTVSSLATVPSGFGYREITAGSLDNVEITLTLYDANDKEMATFKQGFDLRGTS